MLAGRCYLVWVRRDSGRCSKLTGSAPVRDGAQSRACASRLLRSRVPTSACAIPASGVELAPTVTVQHITCVRRERFVPAERMDGLSFIVVRLPS